MMCLSVSLSHVSHVSLPRTSCLQRPAAWTHVVPIYLSLWDWLSRRGLLPTMLLPACGLLQSLGRTVPSLPGMSSATGGLAACCSHLRDLQQFYLIHYTACPHSGTCGVFSWPAAHFYSIHYNACCSIWLQITFYNADTQVLSLALDIFTSPGQVCGAGYRSLQKHSKAVYYAAVAENCCFEFFFRIPLSYHEIHLCLDGKHSRLMQSEPS